MRRLVVLGALTLAAILGTAVSAQAASWSIVPLPLPIGTSYLVSPPQVSCASLSACTVVGPMLNSTTPATLLAEHWNGTALVTQTAPLPSGAVGAEPEGLSCPTASMCMLVAEGGSGVGESSSFSDVWNGSSWAVAPLAAATGTITLNGVSCATSDFCEAVGEDFVTEDGPLSDVTPFAEVWNGKSWTIQSVPGPPYSIAELQAVSCPAEGSCTAVGTVPESGLFAVTLAGGKWSSEPVQIPADVISAAFTSISCPVVDGCAAVGSYSTMGGDQTLPLIEGGNASGFVQAPSPLGTSAEPAALTSVSCVSLEACTAVGSQNLSGNSNAPNVVPLAVQWNGLALTTDTPPSVAGATQTQIDNVTCPAAFACAAVGTDTNSSAEASLLLETSAP